MASKKQTVVTRPVARSEELLVQSVESETVVYDERVKTAHALRPLAAAVFMYADGNNTVEEIAELAAYRLDQTVTVAEVNEAVEQLDSCDLLEMPGDILSAGISRRTALKTFAAAGAGTMLVSSIVAPFASATTLSNFGNPYFCSYANSKNVGPFISASGSTYASDPTVGSVGGSHAPSTWPIPYVVASGSGSSAKYKMAAAGTTGGPVTGTSYNLGGNCFAYVNGSTKVYGTYQVVPCDGSLGYSCANVVCVPTNTGEEVGSGGTASVIAGAITSGPIFTDSGASSFSIPNGTVAPGYGPYTDYAYSSNYFYKICCDDGSEANCKHNNS